MQNGKFDKSKIMCEHPVILLNPKFKKLLWKKVTTAVANGHVIWVRCGNLLPDVRLFYPRKTGVTLSNIDSYYLRNDVTGETYPMYIVVPCGRCILCRAKKSRELMFRAVCETNHWGTIPYFITFTYNNNNLPKDGVQKRDLQLFFKRLRSRLDYYGIEHNLRYLAVAEYGSKTKRAHYHVILWNFPEKTFPSVMAIQHFIEKAWSKFVFVQDKDGKSHRVPLRDDKGRVLRYPSGSIKYQTEQLGFIRVLPMTQGCPAYVTKYMRKPVEVPAGCNPVFMLASNRGGGIGSMYFRENRDFIMNNPTMTKLEVVDKVVSGRIFTCPITQYVKNIVTPSVSQKIPKKDYDIIKSFYYNLDVFMHLEIRFRNKDLLHLDRYDYEKECVRHWYDAFTDWKSRPQWLEAVNRTESYFQEPINVKRDNIYMLNYVGNKEKAVEILWNTMSEVIDRLNNLSERILQMSDFRPFFAKRENYMKARSDFFTILLQNAEPIDTELAVERIVRRETLNSHKDVF